jgi:hypothetical protein
VLESRRLTRNAAAQRPSEEPRSGPDSPVRGDADLPPEVPPAGLLGAPCPLPEVVVHTGFWGCGAFGGNRVMMTLLQLIAAQLAGLDRLIYYVGEPSARASVDRALSLARDLIPFTDTSALIDHIAALGLEWGSSDGN